MSGPFHSLHFASTIQPPSICLPEVGFESLAQIWRPAISRPSVLLIILARSLEAACYMASKDRSPRRSLSS